VTLSQYLAALEKLGLKPCGQATAKALGLSVSQCTRIANSKCPVPRQAEIILRLMLAAQRKPSRGAKRAIASSVRE
jgi:hypothetical protein